MIERVYQSSIPQDDLRHDGCPSRRKPRKRPPEEVEEPEDSFIHSLQSETEDDTEL